MKKSQHTKTLLRFIPFLFCLCALHSYVKLRKHSEVDGELYLLGAFIKASLIFFSSEFYCKIQQKPPEYRNLFV